jgi:uncharacterized repeat protein (TIGR01451 family)
METTDGRIRAHGRARRAWAAVAASALVLLGLVPGAGASAAERAPSAVAGSGSSGDLGVTVEWVTLGGTQISDLQGTTSSQTNTNDRLVGIQIGYSCGPAACAGASIHIEPMELDPYYSAYRFASFDSATLPGGATRTGNATAGYTIALGDLAIGSSGAFTMLYSYQNRASFPAPQSFFPDGFQATASATISATGLASATADDDVTWHISTPNPDVSFFPAADAATGVLTPARVDTDYTYTLYMTPGCYWSGGGHGEPMYECAASYTATHTLPAGVQFVSASNGGTYDAATRTVTWTASGQGAAVGWGIMTIGGDQRSVVVRYPSSMITGPANCAPALDTTLAVSITYLSGATRSATTTKPQTINGCTPFASGSAEKFSSSSFSSGTPDTVVWAGSNQQWTVRVYNRSNVPARGTITDTFDQAGLPVTRIQSLNGSATISATLDDGTVVNITTADYTAPAGRRITAATVVTPTILGPNTDAGDQSKQNFVAVRFHYSVTGTVPDAGFTRTNTAHVSLSFPENPELGTLNAGNRSATVLVTPKPARFAPTLTASVAGGGNPVAGTIVTFTGGGEMSEQDAGVDFRPQYVFVAPVGWGIVPGSAAIAGLADEIIDYRTVTIAGETRQAVFASRPPGLAWGVNQTWPDLTVQATPGSGLAANTTSTATFYMGDAQHNYGPRSAIWGSQAGNAWGAFRYEDAADLDQDGVMTESFAYAQRTLRVGAASGLNVLKEICEPDSSQPDGCAWHSDPDNPLAVAPNTTGITYRVTISNTGTTPLSGVVGYDVLPYPGDTGLTPATALTPRGSTFAEALDSVPASTGVDLAFSASTNPCRDEIYPGAPACDPDWSAPASGAHAIRFTVPGTLAGGASVTVVYLADVVGSPGADARACNSVAVASSTTPVTDPRPVCATIESADLNATAPATLGAQLGRPATIPFHFGNLVGTDGVPATVRISFPAGIEVTDLAIAGWSCTAATPAPVAGPDDIECTPDALIGEGDVVDLPLPILVGVSTATITASIDGPVYDPDPANNDASVALAVAVPVPGGISLAKSDGVPSARAGDQLTYVITVTNELLYEPLTDVDVVDNLPVELEFISATAGGTETAGVVSWLIPTIPSGGTASVEVTVRVSAAARGSFANPADARAADPAFGVLMSASALDRDTVPAGGGSPGNLALTGAATAAGWLGASLLALGGMLLASRIRRRRGGETGR